jgi:CubicO group peptidase (beta-lactamase class C family)
MTSLPQISIEQAGLRPDALGGIAALIEGHIAEGRYTGAQIAIGRHGAIAYCQSFGMAAPDLKAADDTLFLLYSNTKVLTAAVVWALVEQGRLRFNDPVAKHVPEFAQAGKERVQVQHLLTHQAGFPDNHPDVELPYAAHTDHVLLRKLVCGFELSSEPGARVVYHYNAAHWAIAVLVEAVTGLDFREAMRQLVIEPLGLWGELRLGVTDDVPNVAAMFEPFDGGLRRHQDDNPSRRAAGIPAGGAFGTARAMACFYQALLHGGEFNGRRFLSPQTLEVALRDVTGSRLVENKGKPMHFAMGPRTRGTTPTSDEFGDTASPRAFGHTGAGSSLCWADPATRVSLAYIANARSPDPFHSERLRAVNEAVHATVLTGP